MSRRKSQKLPSWIIPSVISTVALTTVGLLVVFPPDWEWVGVGKSQEVSQVTTETINSQSKQKTVSTIKYEQAKNLWDWLSLLGVPLSLALLAWWLQQLQQKRAEEQATSEKEIAEENQQEEVLQAYFDRVSTLLIDKNVLSISNQVAEYSNQVVKDPKEVLMEVRSFSPGQKEIVDAAADVIQARTLSILRRLKDDPVRKASVLLFLHEAQILRKLDVSLFRANLKGADLKRTSLSGADLRGVDFRGADFRGADLSFANLDSADLSFADLRGAVFDGAELRAVDFDGADLDGAILDRVKNMLREQIKQAKNWEKARYNNPAFCKELGLPPGSANNWVYYREGKHKP